MPKPLRIVLRDGERRRPHFVYLAPKRWVALLSKDGAFCASGKSKRDATDRLQERLDYVYGRLKNFEPEVEPKRLFRSRRASYPGG